MLIVLGLFLWYLSGVASFIYWWVESFDFTTDELSPCIIGGLLGPVVFLILGLAYADSYCDQKVLIKKRTPKE